VRQRLQAKAGRFSTRPGFQPGECGDPGGDPACLAGPGLRSGGESLAQRNGLEVGESGAWLRASSVAAVRPKQQGEACGLTLSEQAGSPPQGELWALSPPYTAV